MEESAYAGEIGTAIQHHRYGAWDRRFGNGSEAGSRDSIAGFDNASRGLSTNH
jgi:hypothetical protein